jgi:hypothetical protein
VIWDGKVAGVVWCGDGEVAGVVWCGDGEVVRVVCNEDE